MLNYLRVLNLPGFAILYFATSPIFLTEYSILQNLVILAWFHKNVYLSYNLNSGKATHSQRMCEAASVPLWHLTQVGLSIEAPLLFSCRFIVGHITVYTRL
jgi:hypothetical protein